MADCEFCGSGVDVEGQDMGEGRVMLLCAACRANIKHGQEKQQPMSDARLAAWRDEALEARRVMSGSYTIPATRLAQLTEEYAERYAARLPDLLAEVGRLRAREAALLEVVQAVAFDDPIQPDSGNFVCYYCCACAPYESAVVHGEHCTYEQARALLASDSQS